MPVSKARKKELKAKHGDEQVFVVPFMVVSGIPDKFTRVHNSPPIWNKFDTAGKYIFRYDAEEEASWQQIIPYILIKHPTENKFYCALRVKGDERLVDQISIGFGGHINPEDGVKDIVFKALFRELHEELFIEPLSQAKFIGYIRDLASNTPDHTGCVFIVEAENVSIKEIDRLEGRWMTIQEMEDKYYYKFEGWARHIVDYLVLNKNEKF